MDPFLGQILIVGFSFAPQGWAFCNGQLLSISQNTALFSLLGTTYGGDGRTTFALPNLQSRVPVHFGTGTGLSNYPLGAVGGLENVTLLANQIPAHTHPTQVTANASSNAATDTVPNGNFLAEGNNYSSTSNAVMNTNAVQVLVNPNSGGQPHTNIQPYLALNFIIALQGIFPTRN